MTVGAAASGRLARVRAWLLFAAIAVLLAALADPAIRLERPRFEYLFVLDITQSMNVADVTMDGEPATRLTLARESIRRALRDLPCGSEAGLGMFTEHRTLVLFAPVEVCRNVGAFEKTLDSLDWRLAWVSRSEVAKAIHSAMRSITELDADIRLVFLTDGHEAPPVPEEFLLPIEQYAGRVDGVIGGVGGAVPVPIPVLSDAGELLGYWRAEDVQQVDNYQLGRQGNVANEGVDAEALARRIAAGTEHLSSLREEYLRSMAARAGLSYARVESPQAFSRVLRRRGLAHLTPAEVHLGVVFGGVSLVLFLAYLLLPAALARGGSARPNVQSALRG